MFDTFDHDRSGKLNVRELRSLVRALMGDPSEGELAYFQVGGVDGCVCACVLDVNR